LVVQNRHLSCHVVVNTHCCSNTHSPEGMTEAAGLSTAHSWMPRSVAIVQTHALRLDNACVGDASYLGHCNRQHQLSDDVLYAFRTLFRSRTMIPHSVPESETHCSCASQPHMHDSAVNNRLRATASCVHALVSLRYDHITSQDCAVPSGLPNPTSFGAHKHSTPWQSMMQG
jgi:hypothetical protein